MMKDLERMGYVTAESDTGQKIEDYLPYVYTRDEDKELSSTPRTVEMGEFLTSGTTTAAAARG
jgi:hypothetical protein